jgi:ornithine decarboxylase
LEISVHNAFPAAISGTWSRQFHHHTKSNFMPAPLAVPAPLPQPVAEDDKKTDAATDAATEDATTGLEDLTPAELESVYVVQADAEQDALVTGSVDEPVSGIVISYMLQDDIRQSKMLDNKNLKEVDALTKTIDDQVPEEHIENITLEEVEKVDKQAIEDKLDKMMELYDNVNLMEAMLEQSLQPEGDDAVPYTLDELTVKDAEVTAGMEPAVAAAVYTKYGCLPIAAGGPLAIRELAQSYIASSDIDDSFYIMDLGNVQRLYDAWHAAMPRVKPFYAMKCSPMPALIDVLAANGCGFDCASAAEIQLALDAGVSPDRIIFAHPAKRPFDIRFAASKGVTMTTFDSIIELDKIAKWHPDAQCVLRIRADDPEAGISFGIKYGANLDEYENLISHARDIGLDMIGVSFHVGSLAKSGKAFYRAIECARKAFDVGTACGFHFSLLDIGGGFTGRFNSFGIVQSMVGEIPAYINEALEKFFGPDTPYSDLRVIAEPGRYFAEASMHLACHVHSVRNRLDRASDDEPDVLIPTCDYLISDGLYGSFNCVVYDGAKPRAWLLPGPNLPPMDTVLMRSTVFGPTCDSMDCVFKDVMLPQLRVGDWLLFPHFGAYTLAGATNFNGIQNANPSLFYVCSQSSVDEENAVVMWACEMEKAPSQIVAT